MTAPAHRFDPEHFFYGPDGKPIDLLTWGELFEDMPTRVAACTDVTLSGGHGATLKTLYHG